MLELPLDEVHVWTCSLDWSSEDLENAYPLLSQQEKARAARYLLESLRCRYIAARASLRRLMARYCRCSPEELVFELGEYGKPYIKSELNIEFNISHSADRLVLAFARNRPLGIDTEYRRDRHKIEALSKRFFTPQECREILSQHAEQRAEVFYRVWTRKEAFMKAVGQGLSFGLETFTVDTRPDGMSCLLEAENDRVDITQWSLGSILADDASFATAIAVFGANFTLKYHKEPVIY